MNVLLRAQGHAAPPIPQKNPPKFAGTLPTFFLDTAKRPRLRRPIISADPAAIDHVFTAQGGFALAYKRLVVLAQSMMDTYGGDHDYP